MKNILRAVGDRVESGELHPWHIGLLLGVKNLLICIGVGALVVLSWRVAASWMYLYGAMPFLLLFFWWWYTRHLLSLHHHVSVHSSLLIALGGAIPFMLIFCLSTILAFALSSGGDLALPLAGFFYDTMAITLGAVFLEFTVIVFGLHHPFKRIDPSPYV